MRRSLSIASIASFASFATVGSFSALASISVFGAACTPTLPPAPAHARALPSSAANAPSACWIELAVDDAPGDYGLNASSDFDVWDITFSSLLVRHPKGDVIIDSGYGPDWDDEVKTAHLASRLFLHTLVDDARKSASLPDALRSAGEDPASVRGILLSHIHADHAAGALELPQVPVFLADRELAWIKEKRDEGGFDVVKAVADSIEPRARPIVFTNVPYENFDQSFDLYGDGAIVLVPLPGHTPGSMGTFVNLPNLRVFHLGDATSSYEAIAKRRGKSFGLAITDHDGDEADRTLAKIAQLHALEPNLVLLPAHDRRSWRGLVGAAGHCYPSAGRGEPTDGARGSAR